MRCSCRLSGRGKTFNLSGAVSWDRKRTGIFCENDTSRSISWSERLSGEAREKREHFSRHHYPHANRDRREADPQGGDCSLLFTNSTVAACKAPSGSHNSLVSSPVGPAILDVV